MSFQKWSISYSFVLLHVLPRYDKTDLTLILISSPCNVLHFSHVFLSDNFLFILLSGTSDKAAHLILLPMKIILGSMELHCPLQINYLTALHCLHSFLLDTGGEAVLLPASSCVHEPLLCLLLCLPPALKLFAVKLFQI